MATASKKTPSIRPSKLPLVNNSAYSPVKQLRDQNYFHQRELQNGPDSRRSFPLSLPNIIYIQRSSLCALCMLCTKRKEKKIGKERERENEKKIYKTRQGESVERTIVEPYVAACVRCIEKADRNRERER